MNALRDTLSYSHWKQITDLRTLVTHDLGTAPLRSGRAWLWKCPFHDEQQGFSLAVWADGYRCFGACASHGDVLDWLQRFRHLSFHDALQVLGQTPLSQQTDDRPLPGLKAHAEPPAWDWQQRAKRIVAQAEETLWSDAGEPALAYLTGRGLTTTTIRAARLGFMPGDAQQWRTLEGMHVPCGITIPWFAVEALWAVKVRRAAGTPKYQQIKGGNVNGLYGADGLADRDVALFCEGEFDALLARQEAGNLVAPVTLSSATILLSTRWYEAVAHCHTLWVAYDNDVAGRKGTESLLALSPRFRTLPVPQGKDIGEFYLSGGDIRDWIEKAIATSCSQ